MMMCGPAVLAYVFVYLATASATIPTCGQAPHPHLIRNTRIVGGNEAVPHRWPWMVSVREGMNHSCGGSVIGSHWVISAAHCFSEGKKASHYNVVVGGHDQDLLEPNERTYAIDNYYNHERYSEVDNDITLIKVTEEIEMSGDVQTICLPEEGYEWPMDYICYTTGWGDTFYTGDESVLNEVLVPIISRETCNRDYMYNGDVLENMICAGYEEGKKDACQRDSGGPLACPRSDGTWILAGITSWGIGCAAPHSPGVYTNVSYFSNWIENIINNN